MLIGTAISQFQITPINNTVGVYYHDETRIVISNDRWTLLVHKNLSSLEEAFNNNNKILESINRILSADNRETKEFVDKVKTYITLLNQISSSLKEKFEEISFNTRRFKRGLLDGVGSIFKSITGNLDADDGQFFTDSINKLNNDQHQMENLLKNQISVTTQVIKTFNDTIQKLHINEETLNEDMKKIQISLTKINDRVVLVQAELRFVEICEKLTGSYLYLQSNLDDILNSITFARLKIIHSSIITPENLITALQKISQNLVKNNLPLPVKYSKIPLYLEIIELEAFQSKSDLVFVLRIPLVEQQLYTLYHLYPIPILDNRTGLHHVLSFSQKYIARNDDSLMYIPVKDLSTCKQLGNRKKLCSDLYAYPIDSGAACEAQLLKNFRKIPENCESSLVYGQGYNVQKLQDNVWLIIVSEPIRVTINCNMMDTRITTVNKNAILKLQPDCYAFVGITKVQAESRNTINITDNSHPVLIPYDCCSDIPEKLQLPDLQPLQFDHLNVENLDIANHKLEQYSRDLDKLINEPFVTKHISLTTYLTIGTVIGLIIIYVTWKCRNRLCKKSEEATPNEMLRRINTLLRRRPHLHTQEEEMQDLP